MSGHSFKVERRGGAPGRAFRLLLPTLGVFAVLLFLSDAFALEVGIYTIALIALCTALPAALIICGGRAAAFGALGALAALIIFTVRSMAYSAPMDFLRSAWVALFNAIMARLKGMGYRSLEPLELFGEFADGMPLCGALSLLAIIFSIVFALGIVKRARLIPLLALSVPVCIIVFTYNISESGWGFSLMLCTLAAVCALKLYERTYLSSEAGGSAALCAFLLMLAAVMLPTLTVKERFATIGFIDDRLASMRALTNSILIGDIPATGELGYAGNMDTLSARTIEANERMFTGQTVMTIQSALREPIYLRSWIGYEYNDNGWSSASASAVQDYGLRFGEDFEPDSMIVNFYDAVSGGSATLKRLSGSADYTDELGIMLTAVDINISGANGNLLFIPGYTDFSCRGVRVGGLSGVSPAALSGGLLAFGSDDGTAYEEKYNQYFDGVVSCGWFNRNKRYRTYTLLPAAMNAEGAERFASLVSEYRDMRELYRRTGSVPEKYQRLLDELSRAEFERRYITRPDEYGKFASETYLTCSGSKAVKSIAERLSSSLGRSGSGALYEHSAAMAVIDYLRETCSYTLAPKASSSSELTPLDAFLTDTHEGYCVQFATAAVMILRELGIPARYAEGYIAASFERNTSADRAGYYISSVRDYNAHAWMEVYIEDIGWLRYECTPGYYDAAYARASTSVSGEQRPSLDQSRDEPMYPDENDYSIDTLEPAAALEGSSAAPLITAAVSVFMLTLLIVVIIRGRRALRAHSELIERMRRAELSDRSELRRCVDYIYKLNEVAGYSPEPGELPMQFAERVGGELETLMPSLERIEFGGSIDSGEQRALGEYLAALKARVYASLSVARRIYFRWIRRIL